MFYINRTQLLEYSDTDEEATSLAGDTDPDYSPSSAPSVSSFSSLSEEEQESGEGQQDGEEQEVDEFLEDVTEVAATGDEEFDEQLHLFKDALQDRTPRTTKSSNARAVRT